MLQISCSGFGAENPGKREIAGEQDAGSVRFRRKMTYASRGLSLDWPSSMPSLIQQITPGSYRGWSRKPLAHIHAQTEPVVSPAGAGREHHLPRRVLKRLGVIQGKGTSKPLKADVEETDQRAGDAANRTPSYLRAGGAHVVSEGQDMFGMPLTPPGEGKNSGGCLAPGRYFTFCSRRGFNGNRALALRILAA
jgi:hypothetical protein